MRKLLFKRVLLLCILVCFNLSLKGQTVEKDSLVKYSFIELHDKSYAAKPDNLKALVYANYRLKKAVFEKDTLNIASSYYILNSITKDTIPFVNYWTKLINDPKVNKTFKIIGNIELGDFYFQKGIKDKALENYLNAQKFAIKIKNDSLKSISNLRLGMIKSHNEDFNEAIKLFKSSLGYYNNVSRKELYDYSSIIFNLSKIFNSLKLYDSTYYYNSKVHSLAIKYKDSILSGYTNFNKGNVYYLKGEYINAINFLKKSILFIKLDENYIILCNAYLYLAQSYDKINYKNRSLRYFHKIDSLFQKTGNYYRSQKPAYRYLISYYKNEDNDLKQLEYINKYIKVDSVLNARSKKISKSLTENYDIPNLLKERKTIENRLKERLSTTQKWVILISLFAIIISITLAYQSKRKKLYKQRFNNLVASSQNEKPTSVKIIPKKESSIPIELVNNILKLLSKFQNNHEYILHDVTLFNLAKKFKTNTKYLSQIINQHKGKSFNNYINSLRINYTIEKLKTDTRFRKYSINAIANEVGFNTSESFSKAFYKNTGIKPSYFIKELERK
jgi:AraC-like DNA-binding protein